MLMDYYTALREPLLRHYAGISLLNILRLMPMPPHRVLVVIFAVTTHAAEYHYAFSPYAITPLPPLRIRWLYATPFR